MNVWLLDVLWFSFVGTVVDVSIVMLSWMEWVVCKLENEVGYGIHNIIDWVTRLNVCTVSSDRNYDWIIVNWILLGIVCWRFIGTCAKVPKN